MAERKERTARFTEKNAERGSGPSRKASRSLTIWAAIGISDIIHGKLRKLSKKASKTIPIQ